MTGNCVKKYRIKRDPNIFIIHVLGELKNKHSCIIQYIEENMNLKYSYAQRFSEYFLLLISLRFRNSIKVNI